MRQNPLGKTGCSISWLSLGGMSLERLPEEEAGDLLNAALDQGVNFIDTAPEYPFSEEYIGKTISHRRGEYFLATKCGDYLPGNGPNPISPNIYYSRETFTENIERSLRLLRTDHIDFMQLHGVMKEYLPGGETDELLEILARFKKQGKILHIGATFRNGRPGQDLYPDGYSFLCAGDFYDWNLFETLQLVYGAYVRSCELAISAWAQKGVGVLARGSVRRFFPEFAALAQKANLIPLFEPGETEEGFLLRFALSHPGVSSVLTGTASKAHLLENIASISRFGTLSSEIYEEAKARLSSIGILARKF